MTPAVLFHELMVDALVANYPVAGKTVLEVAADPWLLSAKRFVEHGAGRVISSDMHEGWPRVADDRIETAVIDARRITAVLEPESIDVIYGINLLEHLEDIPEAMESIRQALKPGGFCLIHGHPIWTSARGHHAILGHVGAEVTFSNDTNPVPLWGHLYMTPEEMERQLRDEGRSPAVIACALDWSFDSDLITRKPRNAIIEGLRSGPMNVRAIWEDRLEVPPAPVIDLIRKSPWWDETEDYATRGLTALIDRA